MKILHILINEYETDEELSNAFSTLNADSFVIATNSSDAEKLVKIHFEAKSSLKVFYSEKHDFQKTIYHLMYECLID